MIFADASGVGRSTCVAASCIKGVRCRVAHRGESFRGWNLSPDAGFILRAEAPEDWKQLIETCADEVRRNASSGCPEPGCVAAGQPARKLAC